MRLHRVLMITSRLNYLNMSEGTVYCVGVESTCSSRVGAIYLENIQMFYC